MTATRIKICSSAGSLQNNFLQNNFSGSLQNILKPSAGFFRVKSFPVKKREKLKQHMVERGELCSRGRFDSFSQHGKKGQ